VPAPSVFGSSNQRGARRHHTGSVDCVEFRLYNCLTDRETVVAGFNRMIFLHAHPGPHRRRTRDRRETRWPLHCFIIRSRTLWHERECEKIPGRNSSPTASGIAARADNGSRAAGDGFVRTPARPQSGTAGARPRQRHQVSSVSAARWQLRLTEGLGGADVQPHVHRHNAGGRFTLPRRGLGCPQDCRKIEQVEQLRVAFTFVQLVRDDFLRQFSARCGVRGACRLQRPIPIVERYP